jgi:hypothetical protein
VDSSFVVKVHQLLSLDLEGLGQPRQDHFVHLFLQHDQRQTLGLLLIMALLTYPPTKINN